MTSLMAIRYPANSHYPSSGRICIDVFIRRVQRRVSSVLRQICWEEGVQSKSLKVEVLAVGKGQYGRHQKVWMMHDSGVEQSQ